MTQLDRINRAIADGDKTLDLSGMGITSLDPAISGATHIDTLLVQDNALTSLAGIGALTNLRLINACNNQIASLTSEIGNCTQLRILRLANNPLPATGLPTEISSCTQLRIFGLRQCVMDAIPAEIASLATIEKFYMGGNTITAPDLNPLDSLPNLKVLGLAGTGKSDTDLPVGTKSRLDNKTLEAFFILPT